MGMGNAHIHGYPSRAMKRKPFRRFPQTKRNPLLAQSAGWAITPIAQKLVTRISHHD